MRKLRKSSVKVEHRKRALRDLFKALIMNHLLRNGDGHLKNYGILYENDYTDAVMAPIYDVVCTTVYIKEDIPALKLSDGKLWFKEKTYRNFAKNTCQMKTQEIDETIEVCLKALKKASNILDIYSEQNLEIKEFASELQDEWAKGALSFAGSEFTTLA